jgi:hypothetical protein
MNGRIRRHRRAGPKHNWIGPVLWVLAVAFLALTIVILVKTSPHKGAPKPPVAAAIVLPTGVASIHAIELRRRHDASFGAVVRRQPRMMATRSRIVLSQSRRDKEKGYSS